MVVVPLVRELQSQIAVITNPFDQTLVELRLVELMAAKGFPIVEMALDVDLEDAAR